MRDGFERRRKTKGNLLQVFNLDGETTEEDVKTYMDSMNAIEVDCRSNQNARTRSFRVVIN